VEIAMNAAPVTRALLRVPLLLAAAVVAAACGNFDPAQGIVITDPADGDTVTSPFMVRFAVKGRQVAAASDIMTNTGHYQLLIDRDALPSGQRVTFSERQINLGKGQKEVEVALPPGRYTLTAQLSDGANRSYGDALSRTITVNVK
jgi:Domain of unknown function (DUF4399)